MIKKIGPIAFLLVLTISCQNSLKQSSKSKSEEKAYAAKFIGAWVQPNPINEKEVQGFILKFDGTAESINFATLKYKNWWCEPYKLNLVVESVGNKVSSFDTVQYEVIKITDEYLELKDRQTIARYKKEKK